MAPFREVKTARASGSRAVCYPPAGSAMTRATSTLYRIFYDGLLSPPARAHRHRARPERAAGAALGSRAALPADRPASGDDTRRRAAGESADPRRDVLRSPHPATGHGARLRRGDREVDHAQPAARASAAEPGALEVGGGPRAGQLQRLPESRARRVPGVDHHPAPSRAADRERGRRVGGGLRRAGAERWGRWAIWSRSTSRRPTPSSSTPGTSARRRCARSCRRWAACRRGR